MNNIENKNFTNKYILTIKNPKGIKTVNEQERKYIKEHKHGIAFSNSKINKLDYGAIKLFNEAKSISEMYYRQERNLYDKNKHLHAIIKTNNNTALNQDIVDYFGINNLIHYGNANVLCKTLVQQGTCIDFKDIKCNNIYWEYKKDSFIYHIQPIIELVNTNIYLSKHMYNPYNNVNYLVK